VTGWTSLRISFRPEERFVGVRVPHQPTKFHIPMISRSKVHNHGLISAPLVRPDVCSNHTALAHLFCNEPCVCPHLKVISYQLHHGISFICISMCSSNNRDFNWLTAQYQLRYSWIEIAKTFAKLQHRFDAVAKEPVCCRAHSRCQNTIFSLLHIKKRRFRFSEEPCRSQW
jgi:hypothetical protein